MRIATMTNWAYGITVALTLASGIAMLMASSADNAERRAVEQRQAFDQLSEEVESGAWELSDLARLLHHSKKSGCAAGVPAASPVHRRH
ncbi:diguanylate cyclase [Klebsiella michiganensis]|uniref:Diguanylate cyclase n=1 Tax=Klebsiella michiganensis TaxID=1134687 RepID=A0A7H4N199_9ENTR|nr:diguanylate cyclase [Klebsiella michiganensis]